MYSIAIMRGNEVYTAFVIKWESQYCDIRISIYSNIKLHYGDTRLHYIVNLRCPSSHLAHSSDSAHREDAFGA